MKSVIKYAGLVALLQLTFPAWAGDQVDQATVLMTYRNASITRADFEAEIRRIPEKNREEVLASRSRVGQILENLLLNRVFSMEGRMIGLDKDPRLINEVRLAEDRILARDYLDRQMDQLKLPDFEMRARELYKINPDKYTLKPMVDVSHILVAIKDGKKDEALKRADDIYRQLLAGSNFEDMAIEHSDDKSAKKNGGRLGYTAADQVVKEFADAAFALDKAGDIGKPVESRFGFHIIKLHNKKSGGLQAFSVVRDGIIDSLKMEFLATARKDLINTVRGSSELQVNEAEVEKLKTVLPEPAKTLPDAKPDNRS